MMPAFEAGVPRVIRFTARRSAVLPGLRKMRTAAHAAPFSKAGITISARLRRSPM